MATVIDPVCGMRIGADDAAAIAEREGQTYYFCSEACRDIFVSARSAHGAPGVADTDVDEPEFVGQWIADFLGHAP